jgi:preprotein translocase subunit SecE
VRLGLPPRESTSMSLEPYKPGQGKLARGIAYVLGILLVFFGAWRLYATINRPGHAWVEGVPLVGSLSLYNTVAIVVGLTGLLLLHVVLNRPATVDLLIDTEQEMKKVSWPSRREVQNATIVVVIVSFTLALLLSGFDHLLSVLFQLVF